MVVGDADELGEQRAKVYKRGIDPSEREQDLQEGHLFAGGSVLLRRDNFEWDGFGPRG